MFGVSQTEARTQGAEYREAIRGAMASAASETVLRCGASPTTKLVGKVRDVYKFDKEVILISTDRLSAFDRHLASVPLKGRVLSLISSWWFRRVAEAGITKHHLLRTPHPNVAVVRRCTVFPVEFVVRGYMTVRPPRPPLCPPLPLLARGAPFSSRCSLRPSACLRFVRCAPGFDVYFDLAQLQQRHAAVLRARAA